MLRPHAVLDAIPEPLLFKCKTRILISLKRPRELQGMAKL